MTTTTDEMTSLLSAKADELTAAAAASEQEYADLRIKVQESAWALGWQNSIGSAMERMLGELGLQGRPSRVGGQAKVRLTVRLPDGLSGNQSYITLLADNGIGTGLAMTVMQERNVSVNNIHLPTMMEVSDGRCWCDILDEHADMEQVAKAIREYQDWSESTEVEVLGLRCSGYGCQNQSRTA